MSIAAAMRHLRILLDDIDVSEGAATMPRIAALSSAEAFGAAHAEAKATLWTEKGLVSHDSRRRAARR